MSSNFEIAMKQRSLRNRLASEYAKKHNVDYDIAYKAISKTLQELGNPYLRVTPGSGRASYSMAGKEYTDVPEHYYHQQFINRYETPGYEGGPDWVMLPTADPDTLDMFSDNLLENFIAEGSHAWQYRYDLPFNDPHSAWVRDSLEGERRLQKAHYGDSGEAHKGHGERGTYGITNQKKVNLLQYAKDNLLNLYLNPDKFLDSYASHNKLVDENRDRLGKPTVEGQAHGEGERVVEDMINYWIDKFTYGDYLEGKYSPNK
tara:strand:- start:270 stop:1049 length:780 start_codon:yes stop_codon:yes gene_type:complete